MPDRATLVDPANFKVTREIQFKRLEGQHSGTGNAPRKCGRCHQPKIAKLICGVHVHAAMKMEIHQGHAEVWCESVGESVYFLLIKADALLPPSGSCA